MLAKQKLVAHCYGEAVLLSQWQHGQVRAYVIS